MRARGMAAVMGAFAMWTVVACERDGPSDLGAAPAASTSAEFEGNLTLEPLREAAPGPNARRIKVIVLPEDASVDVDDIPHRRRDGVIEIVGEAGESHRIRWVKGLRVCEQVVNIPKLGAPPQRLEPLDLDTCPAPRLGRPGGASSSSAKAVESAAPTARPVDTVRVPESMQ